MADHIIIFEDQAGGFRWRRVASNGEVISQGESHTRRRDARRAAERANTDVEDIRDL